MSLFAFAWGQSNRTPGSAAEFGPLMAARRRGPSSIWTVSFMMPMSFQAGTASTR